MESAVRSGNLAADYVAEDIAQSEKHQRIISEDKSLANQVN
ncbi:MAG: hypothetical protein Ct9H300mP19_13680 [Dehalococcoidia bacterium]|nr:MAG: hypothetical protein Ct9H300mP19_13680 [Dehalococcoidia bacterium]